MPFLTPNTTPSNDFVCRVIRIPNDPLFVWAVSGALLELTKVWNWEQFGEMTPPEMAQASLIMVEGFLQSEGCMIGMITPFAGETPPTRALLCDGGNYERVDWPMLYAHLDANMPVLIVDADNFNTPDLRNLFVVGAGDNYDLADTGGEDDITLTVDQMPAHDHEDTGHAHSTHGHITTLSLEPGEVPVSSPSLVPENTGSASANITPTGGGEAHENRPPFMALTYVIWGA